MTNALAARPLGILEGSQKLNCLMTGRLGDEITQLRGKRASFAPHWAAPDRVAHALKRDVPLWVIGSVFALFGLRSDAHAPHGRLHGRCRDPDHRDRSKDDG